MANPQGGFGLEFVQNRYSGNVAPVRGYPVAAGTVLYTGSLVRLSAGLLVLCDPVLANNTSVVGISGGYHSATAGASSNWPVISCFDSVFRARVNGDVAAGDVGNAGTAAAFFTAVVAAANASVWEDTTAGFGINDGSTVTGRSTTRLDGTLVASGLRVLDYERRPDNEFGAYIAIYVAVDNALATQAPEGNPAT